MKAALAFLKTLPALRRQLQERAAAGDTTAQLIQLFGTIAGVGASVMATVAAVLHGA